MPRGRDGLPPTGHDHPGDEQEPSNDVEPEDHSPVGDRQDDRTEDRPQHAAELLDRPDDPERRAAAAGRPQVGHKGKGGGHQPTAADALEHAARDEDREFHGERRDGGADDEDGEAGDQDTLSRNEIRYPPDQR